jgi:hypothetical protein
MVAGALSRFQHDFVHVLFAETGATSSVSAIAAQPGFAVYRNTVTKSCVDALQANFPAVTRLVGEEWMRAAAAIYVRAYPPRDPRLVIYGDTFGDFLETFEPARELPYLPGVARLDRYWREAHVARDETTLAGAALAGLAPEALARTILRPHPAARWAWFDCDPIATIWSANRSSDEASADLSDLEWCGDGVLITRPAGQVLHVLVDRAVCVFLDACRAGAAVVQAAAASLAADTRVDFTKLMALLIEAGAFSALTTWKEGS